MPASRRRPDARWSLAALGAATVAGGVVDALVRGVAPWSDGYAAALGARLAHLHGARGLAAVVADLGEAAAAWPLAAPLALAALVVLARRAPRLGLYAFVTLAVLVLAGSRPRYLLPLVPLLALGWWWLVTRGRRALRALALAAPLVAGAVPAARFVVEQRRADPGGVGAVAALAGRIAAATPHGAVVLAAEPRTLSFLADRAVYGPCERPPRPVTHVARLAPPSVAPAPPELAAAPPAPCWLAYERL